MQLLLSETKPMTLREFLSSDIRESTVDLLGKSKYLIKTNGILGFTNVIDSTFSRLEVILMYNQEKKLLVYADIFPSSLGTRETGINCPTEYQIWSYSNLEEEYHNAAQTERENIIERELPSLSETELYKETYADINDWSSLMRYLATPYQELEKPSIYLSVRDDLKFLLEFLLDRTTLTERVNQAYKEEIEYDYGKLNVIKTVARIQAENDRIKEYRDNPTPYIKRSLEIRKALEKAGKTANVITFNDEKVKVKADFFSGIDLRLATGWRDIPIEEVKRITFGKKVLLETDEKVSY